MVSIFNPGTFPVDSTPEDYINKRMIIIKGLILYFIRSRKCTDIRRTFCVHHINALINLIIHKNTKNCKNVNLSIQYMRVEI